MLPRRTFLRGVGATVALPLLDAMVPGRHRAGADRRGAGAALRRGLRAAWGPSPNSGRPPTTGAGFEFSPILKPLEPFREHVTVVSGLGSTSSEGLHAPGPICFLSGVKGQKTEGDDIFNGTTIDQAIAAQIGQDTPLPSIEVATEDFTGFIGACDSGWSCAYLNTISWADADDAAADGDQPARGVRAAVRGHRHGRAAAGAPGARHAASSIRWCPRPRA